jgi:hypothetical protein
MSSSQTGVLQRRRLTELGLNYVNLLELRDVDTISDAVKVAGQAPKTSFARRLARYLSSDARDPAFHLRTVEGELVREATDVWRSGEGWFAQLDA